jgi:hypothetical protein
MRQQSKYDLRDGKLSIVEIVGVEWDSLANAANREWLFIPVPMTLAFSSADPKDFDTAAPVAP